MSDKDKLRKLNNLMYKYPNSWHKSNGREIVFETYNKHKNDNKKNGKWWVNILELVEIYRLADDLKLTSEEVEMLWFSNSIKRNKNREDFKKSPIKEGRDNKDVRVGNGGSNRNKIRYPSKKRSIKTWKKFYNLFPFAAIEDGWTGKTSKRMK